MWSQTPAAVLIAVYAPTGGSKASLKLDVTPTSVALGHSSHPPVIQRHFSGVTDPAAGVDTWSGDEGRLLLLRVPKAQHGQKWRRLFKGDSDGARCLQQPYRLLQSGDEVLIELDLPRWVVAQEDVQVTITSRGLQVVVDGLLNLQRTFWWDQQQAARRGSDYQVVDVSSCSWSVEKSTSTSSSNTASSGSNSSSSIGRGSSGGSNSMVNAAPTTDSSTRRSHSSASSGPSNESSSTSSTTTTAATSQPPAGGFRRPLVEQQVVIQLVRPTVTLEEQHYKKGVRQDNLAATRSCPAGHGQCGYTIFVEEEDEFGLSDALAALLFLEEGCVVLPPKPWQLHQRPEPVRLTDEALLPEAVQQHLAMLRQGVPSGGGQRGSPQREQLLVVAAA